VSSNLNFPGVFDSLFGIVNKGGAVGCALGRVANAQEPRSQGTNMHCINRTHCSCACELHSSLTEPATAKREEDTSESTEDFL
jgi:hypothetical protein